MSESDIWPQAVLNGFPSLGAMRAAHGQLLKHHGKAGDAQEVLAEIHEFVLRGRGLGTLLDEESDRWAAQGLLDYWQAVLLRAGRNVEDSALADFDPALAPELDDSACPYLGLDAFQEKDAGLFFGRSRLVQELVDIVARERLIAVVGLSGSGKSSLVKGGLLPALRKGALEGSDGWHCLPPIVPGSDPLTVLVRLLKSARPDDPRTHSLTAHELFEDPALACSILCSAPAPVVLTVDQFEEAFTLCDSEPIRRAFAGQLMAIADASCARHVVVLTMRGDYEPYVARLSGLQERFERATLRVTPMTASELREVIERPAAIAGLRFEAGIVDELLHDTLGEPAALPLLQFTLFKLWERRERNRVTRDVYRQLGGGRLALARSADELHDSLIPEDQETLRRILLRMVRPGEGLEVTSSRVRLGALFERGEDPARIQRVLDKLLAARLVRRTHGDSPEDDQVEVAHEALVRNWPRLVDWLEQERQEIVARRRLEAHADEWRRLGSGESGLLDEGQLLEAERWLQSRAALALGYDPTVEALVTASRQAVRRARELKSRAARALDAEREVQRQRTFRRRQWLFLAGIAVLLVIASIGWWQASENARETRRVASIASVREATRRIADGDSASGLAYLARALHLDPQNAWARGKTVDLLLRRSWPLPTAVFTLWPPEGDTAATLASVDPTGRYVIAVIPDGMARMWDVLAAGEMSLEPPREVASFGHGAGGKIVVLASSPDGRFLATAADDRTIRLWRLQSGASQLIELPPAENDIRDLALSPEGAELVVVHSDGLAIVRSVQQPQEAIRLGGYSVSRARFSPGGDALVMTSGSQTHLWSLSSRSIVGAADQTGSGRTGRRTFQHEHALAHDATVADAQFSPDGTLVITAHEGGASIWNARNGELLRSLPHDHPVSSAGFSQDGARVVTASRDGAARIWNATTGAVISEPLRHQAAVSSVEFSADGGSVVTAADDGTARVWDVRPGAALPWGMRAGADVTSVQFHPDEDNGRTVLVGSLDGTVRLWDTTRDTPTWQISEREAVRGAEFSSSTGTVAIVAGNATSLRLTDTGAPIPGARAWLEHENSVVSARFSPDGTRVVTASTDGTARVWDASNGQPLSKPLPHGETTVWWAEFSPNGHEVITASDDGHVRLWNLAGPADPSVLWSEGAPVLVVRISRDGRWVVAGTQANRARYWPLSSPHLHGATLRHTAPVLFAAFTPGNDRIVTTSEDGTAKMWTRSQRVQTPAILTHGRPVETADISRDDLRLATGDRDGVVRVWHTVTGDPLGQPLLHDGSVYTVRFSPNGERLATASADRKARVWDLPIGTAEDADRLASLAEAIGGYRIEADPERRIEALAAIRDPVAELRAVRERAAADRRSTSLGTALAQWVLDDRWCRTISPFSEQTVPTFIQERLEEDLKDQERLEEDLKSGSDAGRQEALQAFPGHPTLMPESAGSAVCR